MNEALDGVDFGKRMIDPRLYLQAVEGFRRCARIEVFFVVLLGVTALVDRAQAQQSETRQVRRGSTLWIIRDNDPATVEMLAKRFRQPQVDVASQLAVAGCSELPTDTTGVRVFKLAAVLDSKRTVVLTGERKTFEHLCDVRDQETSSRCFKASGHRASSDSSVTSDRQ